MVQQMTINALPVELHSYICLLSCEEDNATLRSLSQVSSYFNQVSRPYLYHNVCISGVSQAESLLSRLEKTSPHLRFVRHIFVLDSPVHQNLTPSHPSPNREEPLMSILRLCAPTLKTLAIISQSTSKSTTLLARLFRISFPRLIELYISGFYSFPSTPNSFPNLRRLHLHGNRNPHGLLQFGTLESACPKLTELKVSGLCGATTFVIEVEEALKNGRSTGDAIEETIYPARLPPAVRLLVLQAGPEPTQTVRGKINSAFLKDRLMMSRLLGMKEGNVPNVDGIKIRVLDRTTQEVLLKDFRRDWGGAS